MVIPSDCVPSCNITVNTGTVSQAPNRSRLWDTGWVLCLYVNAAFILCLCASTVEQSMWRLRAPLGFIVCGALVGVHAIESPVSLTEWESCDVGGLSDSDCGVFQAPLCYPGVCEESGQVDVFVKRIPAMTDPDNAPNVWFIQGGPGCSSDASKSLCCLQFIC